MAGVGDGLAGVGVGLAGDSLLLWGTAVGGPGIVRFVAHAPPKNRPDQIKRDDVGNKNAKRTATQFTK